MPRTNSDAPQTEAAAPETTEETSVKGRNARLYDDTALRAIGSFEEALALAQDTLGQEVVEAADEIGNGFIVLPTNDKARLVGVPFVILSVDFSEGDNGTYVTAMIVTKTGERLVLNDGSTGIYAQLEEWSVKSERVGGMVVSGGLRRSEYERKDAEGLAIKARTGKPAMATTYYLNV